MKITVCFKIVPDYDQVPRDKWKGGLLLPDFKYVKKIFGVFDEGALETALCLKDETPDVFLEAVSFGKDDSIFTEALYAAGYDSVVYLKNPGSEFDNGNTSKVLSKYLRSSSPDIVLCGEQVGPADSTTVPYLIAEELGFAVLDKVSAMFSDGGKVYFKRQTETDEETYLCDRKILAVVSSAEKPYLRYAQYSKKVEAENKKAKFIPVLTVPKIVMVRYEKPEKDKTETVFLENAAALHELIKEAGV